jgi:leader peptidase (prepilin peptidase)/N-methyltransferase
MNATELLPWAIALVIGVGLLGAIIGSFLNVVVYRLPAGLSIVSPPSACPRCHAAIRSRDNIPVLSWIVLRGRCRDCGEPIAKRYPLVELATAVLFALIALWFLPSIGDALWAESPLTGVAVVIELVAFLYLVSVSVALLLIDLDTRRLPNSLVLPSYVVAALLLGTAGVMTGGVDRLIAAGVGGLALFAFYFVLAFAYPGGMGFGDVKLAGVLGIYLGWMGWGALIVGAFAAFLLGGIISVILIAARGAGRKTAIPFGPWMIAGAFVGLFFGQQIATGYLTLTGLI